MRRRRGNICVRLRSATTQTYYLDRSPNARLTCGLRAPPHRGLWRQDAVNIVMLHALFRSDRRGHSLVPSFRLFWDISRRGVEGALKRCFYAHAVDWLQVGCHCQDMFWLSQARQPWLLQEAFVSLPLIMMRHFGWDPPDEGKNGGPRCHNKIFEK